MLMHQILNILSYKTRYNLSQFLIAHPNITKKFWAENLNSPIQLYAFGNRLTDQKNTKKVVVFK
jgi:hypothetical protein